MCLDFPAQVVAREGDDALVLAEGRQRHASTLLLPDVTVGEWVYVAVGHIVDRIPQREAHQIIAELTAARGALK